MTVFDLFSKRQRRLLGNPPDVYQYKTLPQKFRVQVAYILEDLFGDPDLYESETQQAFKIIHDILVREYGVFKLARRPPGYEGDYRGVVLEFFGSIADTDQALSVIELSLRVGRYVHERNDLHYAKPTLTVDQAIEDLNVRFREHGVGYQFESNKIIRVDSQTLHEEAVKPALRVLMEPRFDGANEEYLTAHDHYRHGRHGDAVNWCLKSFESTLKVICKTRRWPYKETDTAKPLLDIVFGRGLVPNYLEGEFAGLRSVLESGVPTTRSRESAHGAGSVPKHVPPHLTSYVLHLTASSILFFG